MSIDVLQAARNKGYVLAYDVINPKPVKIEKVGKPDSGVIHFTSLQLYPDNSQNRGMNWYLKSGFLRPHPLFDEIQNYTYTYRLTKPGSSDYYDLKVQNAEMFKIPFLGRFLQLAQYMYYVYGIKLVITEYVGTGVRSLEEQLSEDSGSVAITPTISMSTHTLGLAVDINMMVSFQNSDEWLTAKFNLLHFLWMLLQAEQNSFGFYSGYDFDSPQLVPQRFEGFLRTLISTYGLSCDVVHLQHQGASSLLYNISGEKIITNYITYLKNKIESKKNKILSENLLQRLGLSDYNKMINYFLFQLLRYFTEFNIRHETEWQQSHKQRFQVTNVKYTGLITDQTINNKIRDILDEILVDILVEKSTNSNKTITNIITSMTMLHNISNINNTNLSNFPPIIINRINSRNKVQTIQDNIKSNKLNGFSSLQTDEKRRIQWDLQGINTFVSSLRSHAPFLTQNYINSLFLNTSNYTSQNIVKTDAYKFTFDKTQFWTTWNDYSFKSIPSTVKTYSNTLYTSTTTSNSTSTSNSISTSNSTVSSTFNYDTKINISITSTNTISTSKITQTFTSIDRFTRLISSIDQ